MSDPSNDLGHSLSAPPRGRGKRAEERHKVTLVSALGVTQILAWGTTFYLPAVLAAPIARDTGWALALVVAGLSWGLLVAGSLSPRVGRIIDRHGGRLVLTGSSLLIALGLFLLSLAGHPLIYFAAWTVIGVGMAAGLYDACFALLGRLYGASARSAITGLTLFGGLASTLCWPAVSALEQSLGWRDSCLIIATVHLLVNTPLHFWAIPGQRSGPARPGHSSGSQPWQDRPDMKPPSSQAIKRWDRTFLLICSAFTALAFVMSSLSVHLLEILRQSGIGAATAIAIGMAVGPAQVAGRVLEFAFGSRLHPVWSARVGGFLCLCGVLFLVGAEVKLAFVAAVIYGAGNGILTIAKGTLPLAIFGPEGYGERMGRLARPMLFAQASAPVLAAMLMQQAGAGALLTVLGALLMAGCILFACLRSPTSAEYPAPGREATAARR